MDLSRLAFHQEMPGTQDIVSGWDVVDLELAAKFGCIVIRILDSITPGLHEFVHSANHLEYLEFSLKLYDSLGHRFGRNGEVLYDFPAFCLINLAVVHDGIYIINFE